VIARSLRLPTLLAIGLAVGAAVFIGPLLELVIGQEVGLGWAPAAFGLTLALAPWIGISRTALVTLGGSRWLLPSQAAISGMSVAASFLAVGGVLWAAVAVSAANLLGSLVRWLGIRALGHLPGRGWLGFGEWRADLVWLWGAARRKGVG
jgi:hypothetical protein